MANLTKTFDNVKLRVSWTQSSNIANIVSGPSESISVSLGKIAKWFSTYNTNWKTTYSLNESDVNGYVKFTTTIDGEDESYDVKIHGLQSAAFHQHSEYAPATHSHNYAGSDSAGGPANNVKGTVGTANASSHVWFSNNTTETLRNYDDDFKYNPSTNTLTVGSITGSASKLSTDAGSSIKPVYFSNGIPVACSHTIETDVPQNAEFTDQRVNQAYSTTNNNYPLLFSSQDGITSTSSRGNIGALLNNQIYVNPYYGSLKFNEWTPIDITNETVDLNDLTPTSYGGYRRYVSLSREHKSNLPSTFTGGYFILETYGTNNVMVKQVIQFGLQSIYVRIYASSRWTEWQERKYTDTTYSLSGAYGTDNNTWITTLTPSSGTVTRSTVPTATTSAYGITKLTDSVSSTSTTTAATPSAVKTAYDKAVSAYNLADGKSAVSYTPTLTSGSIIGILTINGTQNTLYYNPSTDTDTKVTQTQTDSTNVNYEVLFAQTTDQTTKTEEARKSSKLKFNPANGNLIIDNNVFAKLFNGYLTRGDGVAHTQSNRETTLNIASTNKAGMRFVLSTSSITDGSRYGDGYVLHFEWDNSSNFSSQLFISNNVNGGLARRSFSDPSWSDWVQILDTMNTTFTPTLTSGTKIGTLKIGTSTTDLYCQTNTNTDTKVTQTNTTTSKAYRVLLSYDANDNTETNISYKSGNLTFNPSTKTLTTTTFAGNATTATTASKLSNTTAIGSSTNPVYFSANGVPVACTSITANEFKNKTLTSSTLDNTSGSFTFEGDNLFGTNYDWVGLQLNYLSGTTSYDKGQMIFNNGRLLIRQNDTQGAPVSDWSAWVKTMAISDIVVNNGLKSEVAKTTVGSITYESTITIGHSNSVTAVTTEGLLKVKYDAQGHITGSSAVTASDLPTHTHNYAGSATAGGAANSVKAAFKLQKDDTAVWTYNGSEEKTLNIKAGSNMSIDSSNGTITFNATNTDTDTKVTQTQNDTSTSSLELLMAPDASTTTATTTSIKSSKLKFVPSTGTLTATKFSGDGSSLTNVKAVELTNKTLTKDTIDTTSGSFTFQGNNLFGHTFDWVGLQVDYKNFDRWQLMGDGTRLLFRQNDSASTPASGWTEWTSLLLPESVNVSGGLNRTISTITVGSVTYNSGVTIELPDWNLGNTSGGSKLYDASMSDQQRANRFAGVKAGQVVVERSSNSGSSWATDTSVTRNEIFTNDQYPIRLVTSTAAGAATSACQLRITIDCKNANIYTALKKIHILLSTNYSKDCKVTVTGSLSGTPDTFDQTLITNQSLSGWSGWNVLNLDKIVGGTNSTYIAKLRFLFTTAGLTDTSITNSGLTINRICAYGGVGWNEPSNLGKYDRPYKVYSDMRTDFQNSIIVSAVGNTDQTYGQFRACATKSDNTNYGFMIRNDGTASYLLLTDANDQFGVANTYRPLKIDNATGILQVNTIKTPDSSSETNYAVMIASDPSSYGPTTSGLTSIYKNNNFRYKFKTGTASVEGCDYIVLGNPISTGTAGNSTGKIVLYSPGATYASTIVPTTLTAGRTITLPDASGTVALTSHTHSTYVLKSGDAMTGNLTMGTANQNAVPTAGISIQDIRNATLSANSGPIRAMNMFFTNKDTPYSSFWSIIHMCGWSSDYSKWELAGPSHTSDQRTTPLYVRTSNAGTAWGSWRKIYDASNPPTAAEVGASPTGHTHPYLPLAGGTMNAGADIIFPTVTSGHMGRIIQYQRDESNYTQIVEWYKNGQSQNTYNPQIGQHNTGGTNNTGSITILPYPTSASPWLGNVGLYITETQLKFNGTDVSLNGHTHNYAGSSSAGGAANSVKASLTLQNNGTNIWTFNGSTAQTLNIKAGSNMTITNSGGTITFAATTAGRAVNTSGGAWIETRDRATAYNNYVNTTSGVAVPCAASKSKSGVWAISTLSSDDNLYFVYTTDANYTSGTNTATSYTINTNGVFSGAASKLSTNAGSSTNPVYFSGGVPVACTYSLNATVPSGAKFTDTTYSLSGALNSSNQYVVTLTPSSGTASTATIGVASTSAYGITKLSSATNSTSTALAATASAVKSAYDLANGKSTVSFAQTLTSGTVIGKITINNTETTLYCQTNTNTDTLVKQTVDTTSTAFPILIRSNASATSGTAGEAKYVAGVTITPSTKTITATTFAGNATSATTATTATTASKLSTNAGSASTPVYFSGGVPVACTSITATGFKNKTLTSSTLDNTSGSFTFEGDNLFGTNYDWVGLQVAYGTYDKWQLMGDGTRLLFRQNDDAGVPVSGWKPWSALLLPESINVTGGLLGTVNTFTVGNVTYNSGVTIKHSNSVSAITSLGLRKIMYDAQGHITGSTAVAASDLPAHDHQRLIGASASAAVPISALSAGEIHYYYNANTGLSGNMPSTNNANSILYLSRHNSDNYYSQLGFSNMGTLWYRSTNGSAITSTTPWYQIPISIRSEATLSANGWYRIWTIPASSGHTTYTINFEINRTYASGGCEGYSISIVYAHGLKPSIICTNSKVLTRYITQIRFSYAKSNPHTNAMYIDLYYASTNANFTICKLTSYGNAADSKATPESNNLSSSATVDTSTYNSYVVDTPNITSCPIKLTDANVLYTHNGQTDSPLKVWSTELDGSGTYNYGSASGSLLTLGFNGLTIIGGGESPKSLANLIKTDTGLIVPGSTTKLTGESENLILSADASVYILTNCNTIENRKGIAINTSLEIYPDTNNTGSVGAASYKFANMYATTFHGALDGTATNANNVKVTSALSLGTAYNFPLVPQITTAGTSNQALTVSNNHIRLTNVAGTTSAGGNATLLLGNRSETGTANNALGQILLYSSSSYGVYITPAQQTSDHIMTIPDVTGTALLMTKGSTSYWGLQDASGASGYIRTTTSGFIPSQSGGAKAGHSSLGTDSWRFANAYVNKVYADRLAGYLIRSDGVEGTSSRESTLNITPTNMAGVRFILSTSSISAANGYPGDGYTLHFEWDNGSQLSSQFWVPNSTSRSLKWRARGSSGWGDWIDIMDDRMMMYSIKSSAALSTKQYYRVATIPSSSIPSWNVQLLICTSYNNTPCTHIVSISFNGLSHEFKTIHSSGNVDVIPDIRIVHHATASSIRSNQQHIEINYQASASNYVRAKIISFTTLGDNEKPTMVAFTAGAIPSGFTSTVFKIGNNLSGSLLYSSASGSSSQTVTGLSCKPYNAIRVDAEIAGKRFIYTFPVVQSTSFTVTSVSGDFASSSYTVSHWGLGVVVSSYTSYAFGGSSETTGKAIKIYNIWGI